MRVAFRVDASRAIGTGHVMRCLTLADELRRRGADVLFICRRHAGNLCGLISEKGFRVECLPPQDVALDDPPAGLAARAYRSDDENPPAHAEWLGADWRLDAEQTGEAIRGLGVVDWLVVDHYALDARWESAMRAVARRIMVIDDLADREHDCDLLLDQNLYPEIERRYATLIPACCRTLLGPQYALLRPEFAEARANLRERTGHVRRVLISFGGVDATNETQKAIEAFDELLGREIEADVVVGAANPHREALAGLAGARPSLRLHLRTNRMAELMAQADLAVGGAGVETWERASVGCPALMIALADNQAPIAEAAEAAGVAFYVGSQRNVSVTRLSQALADVTADPGSLVAASERCLALGDVQGCLRVADALEATT